MVRLVNVERDVCVRLLKLLGRRMMRTGPGDHTMKESIDAGGRL